MIVNVELANQVLPFGVLDRGAPNGTKSEAGRRKGGGGGCLRTKVTFAVN